MDLSGFCHVQRGKKNGFQPIWFKKKKGGEAIKPMFFYHEVRAAMVQGRSQQL